MGNSSSNSVILNFGYFTAAISASIEDTRKIGDIGISDDQDCGSNVCY